MTSQDDIKNVLEGLFSGIQESSKKSFASVADLPAMQAAATAVREGQAESFYYSLIYPLSKMVDGLLSSNLQSEDAKFLFKHSQFVERHYKRLFERFEGSACCADKSRTILRRLVKYFTTGEEIKFNYSGEVTYHLPVKIFKTHAQILQFYKALQHLYYGSPDTYLKAMSQLVVIASGEPGTNLPAGVLPGQNENGSVAELQKQRDQLLGLLGDILQGDEGRRILGVLATGQGTETADGKTWLAAKAAVAGIKG